MKTLLKIALFALLSCPIVYAETDLEKRSRLAEEVKERLSGPPDELLRKIENAFPELVRELIALEDKEGMYVYDEVWMGISMSELFLAAMDGKWSEVERILKSRLVGGTLSQEKLSSCEKPFILALPDGYHKVKMEFMPIPAGKFVMGSPKNEEGHHEDEDQVQVNITKAFYMGKTEVTEAQYATMMFDDSGFSDFSLLYPVTRVSWSDAMEFCKRLTAWAHERGKMLGWKFTLPTEAQWEYACRAGTTTMYHSGDGFSDLMRVVEVRECVHSALDKELGSYAVMSKEPNAWGLYDMHGNVIEWCLDWYGSRLQGGDDPTGPKSGSAPICRRICRGGSWRFSDFDDWWVSYRSAARGGFPPKTRFNTLGFRVALVRE